MMLWWSVMMRMGSLVIHGRIRIARTVATILPHRRVGVMMRGRWLNGLLRRNSELNDKLWL